MKRVVFLLAFAACDDDRHVEIHAANSTHIVVDTKASQWPQGRDVAEIKVEVASTPTIALVPMPIPYVKQPVTAEKP